MSDFLSWVNVGREEYLSGSLDESQVVADPIEMFRKWFEEARGASVPGVDELVLSTVSAEGRPSSRVVLLKAIDATGLLFVTNYSSHKGRDIAGNPHVAMNFWWKPLERQVRVEGMAEIAPGGLSDIYHQRRPRESQLGAVASPQSQAITNRGELEALLAAAKEKFEGREIPRPSNWGAYLVRPSRFEFWQGRASRLHDRIEYAMSAGGWERRRLAP